MKRLIVSGFAAVGVAVGLACPAHALTPDEWGMDDGIGVGHRVAGTPCRVSERHEWADSVDGSGVALWCPPPAFVWVHPS
jgi:hypothetical protein